MSNTLIHFLFQGKTIDRLQVNNCLIYFRLFLLQFFHLVPLSLVVDGQNSIKKQRRYFKVQLLPKNNNNNKIVLFSNNLIFLQTGNEFWPQKMTGIAKTNASISVQERCSDWVESQQDLSYEPQDKSRKRPRNDNVPESLQLETESEFDSVSECGGKRRRVGRQSKEETLHLQCEWKDCTFTCATMDIFVDHVANHIPQLKIKQFPDGMECYCCQWTDCKHESDDSTEISTHVNYHSYHSKLKCIGTNHRKRIQFPVLGLCWISLFWE